MSDLDRFELFIQVAQAETLGHAATMLGTSKASLSKHIKRLEADLKIDLFSRNARRLILTALGKKLLSQCLRLKKELDDTRSICNQLLEQPEGIMRVIAFEYFAKQLIFPKLEIFLKRYPKLELIIDTSERIPDFEREQIDLAIGFSLPAPLDIIRRSITTTRYVLCASPKYFAKNGIPKKLTDLNKHYYIGHCGRAELQKNPSKVQYKLRVRPSLLLNSVSAMIECAKQGIGLIQLPLYLLQDLLVNGELIEVLNQFQSKTPTNVYFYYPKYRFIQPKVRKFIDFFLTDNFTK